MNSWLIAAYLAAHQSLNFAAGLQEMRPVTRLTTTLLPTKLSSLTLPMALPGTSLPSKFAGIDLAGIELAGLELAEFDRPTFITPTPPRLTPPLTSPLTKQTTPQPISRDRLRPDADHAPDSASPDLQTQWEKGVALYNAGNYGAAIPIFEALRPQLQAIDDRATEATLLSYLAMSRYFLGDYAPAIEELAASIALSAELNDPVQALTSRLNLALVYSALGQEAQSLALGEENLQQARSLGRQDLEASILGNLGLLYRRQARYGEAIGAHQQAAALFQTLNDQRGAAYELVNLSLVYQQLRRWTEAIAIYQQALPIFIELADRRAQAMTLGNLSAAYTAIGDFTQAAATYPAAVQIFRELGDRRELAIALQNLGVIYTSVGNLDAAETVLYESIDLWDAMRSPDLSDADRVAFFESQKSTFEYLQQVLLRRGQWGKALEVNERSRARAFVFLLDQQLATTPADLDLTAPSIAEMFEIAADHQATIVQYGFVDHYLLTWVLHPDGTMDTHAQNLDDLPISLDGMILAARCPDQRCESRILERMRNQDAQDQDAQSVLNSPARDRAKPRLISDQTPDRQNSRDASLRQTLYDILIAPIADTLPIDPDDLVIFVPQNQLLLVSFAALQTPDGSYLINHHTISTTPSIDVLAKTRQLAQRREPHRAALIVGNPTMPDNLTPLAGAAIEAEQVADLWSTVMLTGDAATKAHVLAEMPEARVIHLATHGIFDEQSGLASAIALAPSASDNGWLTAAQILDLSLSADLVALSACSTGLGRITGDGVIGLSRSLMAAGVPSVLVSLWNVNDQATAELMVEFYRHWQGTDTRPMTKAQALRQAMLATQAHYPNPYYWGAFTLIGEPE